MKFQIVIWIRKIHLMDGLINCMKDDLTISRINDIKYSINSFIETLKNFSQENSGRKLPEAEIGFFRFISKQIIFLKMLYEYNSDYALKVAISDYYNLVACIIKNENRYIFVNERSIIENYIRYITSTNGDVTYVNRQIFDLYKVKCRLSNDDYSLIKEIYSTSCGYIHGSKLLDENLAYVFNQCITTDYCISKMPNHINNLIRMINIFNDNIIQTNKNVVDLCFFRQKSILKYLIGENAVNKLFM